MEDGGTEHAETGAAVSLPMYAVPIAAIISVFFAGAQLPMVYGTVAFVMTAGVLGHAVCPGRSMGAVGRHERFFLYTCLAAGVVGVFSLVPLPAGMVDLLSPFTALPWRQAADTGLRAVSAAPEISFEWLTLGATAAALYVFGRTFSQHGAGRFMALITYAAAGIALAAMVFYAADAEPNMGLPCWESSRLRGFYTNPNRFAVWLAMSLFVGVGHYLDESRSKLSDSRVLTALGIVAGAIVLTASRGAALSIVAAGCMVIIAARRSHHGSARYHVLPGGMFIIVAIAAAYLYPRLSGLHTEVERLQIWGASLAAWADHPVFGSGPGTFGEIFPFYQPGRFPSRYSHAHNEYMELLVELGPAGLLTGTAFAALLVNWWKKLLGAGRGAVPIRAIGGLGALTVAAVASMFDFPLRQPSNLFLFALIMGVTSGEIATARCVIPGIARFRRWIVPAVLPVLVATALVASGGWLRHIADRKPPEQAIRLLATADALEPGAGDNLRSASSLAYTAFWNQPSDGGLELASELADSALNALPRDVFLNYESAMLAVARNEAVKADMYAQRSLYLGRDYSGIRESVAAYFLQRYVVTARRHRSFIVLMRQALENAPAERQFFWACRLMDSGALYTDAMVVLGPEAGDLFVEELFRRRMWGAVVGLTGPEESPTMETLALRAGAFAAAGDLDSALDTLDGIGSRSAGNVEERLKSAVETARDRDGVFLRAVAGHLSPTGENYRWLASTALRCGHGDMALTWAAEYLELRHSPPAYLLAAEAYGVLGDTDRVVQMVVSGLDRHPDAPMLWCRAVQLLRDGLMDTATWDAISATRQPPRACVLPLAEALVARRRFAEAVAILENTVSEGGYRGPELHDALRVLAAAYRGLGLEAAGAEVEQVR
ncbi:MAG: O-antigen ligase family protein [Planctomycetes bacterium]|nr:O-antigen ligase family protein [Planctomycetota bacterium]